MPAKRSGGGGFDIGMIFAHKILTVLFLLSTVGWIVAFIGQCAAEAGSGGRQGVLWFAIFLQLFLIVAKYLGVMSDSLSTSRLQLVTFTAVALVFSVIGINSGIYSNNSSEEAVAAGWFLITITNIVWLLFLTTEEDSALYPIVNLTNQGVTPPGLGGVSRSGGRYNAGAAAGAQSMRNAGGAIGGGNYGAANGSAYSAGFQPGTTSAGYQPAYGNSPSAADITTANGTGLGAPKLSSASIRSRGANDAAPTSAGVGAVSQDGAAPSVASHGAPASPAQAGALPDYGYKARALYAYQANADDPTEISFSKGEVLDIVDNSGKWWQARKSNGQTGIVPSNYMQLL